MKIGIARKESRCQGTRGFTLIELLVVIAIIAILASIIFPVFARARENARRASCQNNLKQMALGVLQYIQDYDDRFPLWGGNGGCAPYVSDPLSWAAKVQPYVKSTQIFKCPSDYWNNNHANDAVRAAATMSYANNRMLGPISDPANPPNPVSMASVVESSKIIMWAENEKAVSGFNTIGCNAGMDHFYADTDDLAYNRHLDGSNFAFVDGHVKWFKTLRYTGPTYGPTMYGISLDPAYNG